MRRNCARELGSGEHPARVCLWFPRVRGLGMLRRGLADLVSSVLLCVFAVSGCDSTHGSGKIGDYPLHPMVMRLTPPETLLVYRVTKRVFPDGSQPALQLEFEAPFDVRDTILATALAVRVWPSFLPYVEGGGFRAAIVTATNLHSIGQPGSGAIARRSFGLVAQPDSIGVWRFAGALEALPGAEKRERPSIYLPNGTPLSISFP